MNGMQITTIHPPKFPTRLTEIDNKPQFLVARGDTSLLTRPCFAVVGTRGPTHYGIRATTELVTGLVRAGFCIVSGLAYGIDAAAHQAALDAGGTTIAVLASSLDNKSLYPQGNLKLAHDIIQKGGCLVSEQLAPCRPFKYQFPLRNRIISGLSLGVLIIEAQKKSGALITAQRALEQNRDVFAVPGNIYSPTSQGTNALIQKGAYTARNITDILTHYEHIPGITTSGSDPQAATYTPADRIEHQILQNLTSEPKYIDFIVRQTGLAPQTVLVAVTLLESRGVIKTEHGKCHLTRSINL